MAFIAGYVAARPQPVEVVHQRLYDFSIVPGESAKDYVHIVRETRFGHLLVKHKKAYPIRPQIASDEDGNVVMTLGYTLSGDTAALFSAAISHGARSLEASEGEFVAVFVEAASGTVHVINDRFASRPFYIVRSADGVFFSSNLAFLLTLAGTQYCPDVVGWLEVCTVGHTIGTRTTTDAVQRLRPATHMTITPGRVTESQYWRLTHSPDPTLDPATHSAAVFQAFRAGAQRRAHLVGRGVVALSGGLDSRLVAGALSNHGDYSAFTFIDTPGAVATAQSRAAEAVCAAIGMRHHVEPLPSSFARASEVIALTSGMRGYHHMANVMSYVDELRRLNTNFLLGGGPGDVLAGSYIPSTAYLDPLRTSECIEEACGQRFAGIKASALLFRDEVVEGGRAAVKDTLADSFGATTGPTAAHRLTAWAMTCRQPAFTFTTVLHTHPDVTESVCHLDYRYSDLMLMLPASWLYHRAFYAYMIYSALPHLRHIPYANTGRLLSADAPTHDVRSPTLVRRTTEFTRSFGARVVGRIRRGRVAPSLVFKDVALLEGVRERVHSSRVLSEILDVKRCDDLLASTRAGACPSEEMLGVLVSLAMSVTTL